MRKFENVILKGPICPKTVTNRDQVIAQALFDKNFGMLTVNLVISGLPFMKTQHLQENIITRDLFSLVDSCRPKLYIGKQE